MSHMGELIAEHMAAVRAAHRAAVAQMVTETDPDPAWFEAPCPACGQIVWWQTTGRDSGRTFSHEIHCDCTEPAA